ncbi:MAG: YbaB/EbfC family nucleoid-associated protein [Patescibacteria group bacterium]|nr:YbaB/EbfC family nucleoid-associated protein [Patescibacteria group bacterium]
MSMFGKAKENYDLVKKAREIQKKLKSQTVEGESGAVKIIMNGEQKIQSVEIDKENLDNIESDIKIAVSSAIEKSQKIAAEMMKDMGGLGGFGL